VSTSKAGTRRNKGLTQGPQKETSSSQYNSIKESVNNILQPIEAAMQPTEDKSYVPSQFKNNKKTRPRQGCCNS
jgi:hypothetical protein